MAAGVRAAPEPGGACGGKQASLSDLYNLHQNTLRAIFIAVKTPKLP